MGQSQYHWHNPNGTPSEFQPKVESPKRKPILCLDFDGVLHGYQSGWQGADVCPDPPVEGAMEFVEEAVNHFTVAILSSRSHQSNGIVAMQTWMRLQLHKALGPDRAEATYVQIQWPTEKPPAVVTIDDRALTFIGIWPSIEAIRNFKPWNKQ